jgi:putative endonuclease
MSARSETRPAAELGRYGERLAEAYLRAGGWEILSRNWRCRAGELDIVARDGAALVIVEVKCRSSTSHGTPAEAVHPVKARRIRGLALSWLADYRAASSDAETFSSVRFDVISVLTNTPEPTIDHHRGAF